VNYFDEFFVRSEYLSYKLQECGIPKEKIRVVLPFDKKESITPIVQETKTVLYLSSAEKSAGAYTMLNAAKLLPDYKFTLAIRKFGAKEEVEFEKFSNELAKSGLKNVEIKRTLEILLKKCKKQLA
jgi:hypothetical protein